MDHGLNRIFVYIGIACGTADFKKLESHPRLVGGAGAHPCSQGTSRLVERPEQENLWRD